MLNSGGFPSAKPNPQPKSITVPRGATLPELSKQYGVSVGDILKANPTIGAHRWVGSSVNVPSLNNRYNPNPQSPARITNQPSVQPPAKQPLDIVSWVKNQFGAQKTTNDLYKMAKTIADNSYKPVKADLDKAIKNIKVNYDIQRQNLIAKQKKEDEDLAGQYSNRGLLQSGMYTSAQQDLQQKHQQELADLTNKENQTISDLNYKAVANQPSIISNIVNSLMSAQASRRNEAINLLNILAANERAEKTRKSQVHYVTGADAKGIKYLYTVDSQGRVLAKIPIGVSTSKPTYKNVGGTLYAIGENGGLVPVSTPKTITKATLEEYFRQYPDKGEALAKHWGMTKGGFHGHGWGSKYDIDRVIQRLLANRDLNRYNGNSDKEIWTAWMGNNFGVKE